VKLADFGLAIEVQGDQQAWFGKSLNLIHLCVSLVGPSLWNRVSLTLRLFLRTISNSFYARLKTFLFSRTGIWNIPEFTLKGCYRNAHNE